MGKFHKSKGKQKVIQKKLSEKKRQHRRDRKKSGAQLKVRKSNDQFKVPTSGSNEENRVDRSKSISEIQKSKRSNLHMFNRNLSDVSKDESSEQISLDENAELADKLNANKIFKSYYKEFKKVVEAADVVIEVLDARDPLGSRCKLVEQAVINAGPNKRLVLLLNKIDLIPKENLSEWLKYLREEFPTVPFKASTQSQNDHLSRSKVAAIHMNHKLQSSTSCVGANYLMKVLGNYCRNREELTSIKVGVVGYPNVGKSSIINSLKRSRTCDVGAVPGVTKTMQEIILDKHIRLLDSPGVVFAKEGSQATLALRNALKVETLDDVISPAKAIILRIDRAQLVSHYKIEEFSSEEELLYQLAKKMGRYKKGGVLDHEAAARKLLNDWNSGIIKYFTHPPEDLRPMFQISSEIAQQMSKEFDISEMDEQMELDQMIKHLKDDVEVPKKIERMEIQNIIPDPIAKCDVSEKVDLSKCTNFNEKSKRDDKSEQAISVLRFQKNKQRKMQFKQLKKNRRRRDKVAAALSESMDNALSFLV